VKKYEVEVSKILRGGTVILKLTYLYYLPSLLGILTNPKLFYLNPDPLLEISVLVGTVDTGNPAYQ